MKILDFKCKRCGCTKYYIRNKDLRNGGVAKGVYCLRCGRNFKFLAKDEKMSGTPAEEYEVIRFDI